MSRVCAVCWCLALSAGVACGVFTPPAHGAHFWLSTSAVGGAAPTSPTLGTTVGDTTTFYVWGRPTPGRQFDGVSLDVVASATGIDFVDGTYTFYNAIDAATDRFVETLDSATILPGDIPNPLRSDYPAADVLDFGEVDALRGLRGFTLSPTPGVRGPGPVCGESEANCAVAADGEPAWLIASLDISAIATASVELRLQIGDRGVVERTLAPGDYNLDGEVTKDDYDRWVAAYGSDAPYADGNGDSVVDAADYTLWRDHLGALATGLGAADTVVRFGTDSGGRDEPGHNASTDKQINLFGDDPDATITVSPAAPAASVPEPAAAWCVAAAGLGGLIRFRPSHPTRRG